MGARGSLTGSRVVCLKNMVGAEEVDEQLQEEIEEECSKVGQSVALIWNIAIIYDAYILQFGEVENVIIYQERQSEEEDAVILVKIFVEFTNINEAKVCWLTGHINEYRTNCSACICFRWQETLLMGDFSGEERYEQKYTTRSCTRNKTFRIETYIFVPNDHEKYYSLPTSDPSWHIFGYCSLLQLSSWLF